MMYIRFFIVKVLEAVGALLGIILFPLVYALRHQITDNPTLFKWLGLWWLTNQDEPNFLENWYGFYELHPDVSDILWAYNRMSKWQRFKQSFEWVALRNPTWQLKLALARSTRGDIVEVKVHKVVGEDGGMVWRDKSVVGFQFATFYIYGRKHFRYSWTKRIGNKWVNVMLGTKQGRYVSKFRIFNELGRWG